MSALNVFKTVTANVTTTSTSIYTAPTGKTAIVLMSQFTNITTTPKEVTFLHVAGAVETELLKDFGIPGNDAVSGTVGKLVIEESQSVKASAEANSSVKMVLSILETSN
jgi:hypothetical protein